jgi:tagaturonate reductase
VVRLNKKLLKYNLELAGKTEYNPDYAQLPEKIIQFGEGNFLRAFSDWMIDRMNKKNLFNGRIVAVQPIEHGLTDIINEQDGLYTVLIRGIQKGENINRADLVSSISRCINPYVQWDEYLKCAEDINIKYAFTNTTEAGIVYRADDKLDDKPPVSFPGKFTLYLYHRYKHFNGAPESGMVIFAEELIERNGDKLKEIILRFSDDWKLPKEFIKWVNKYNYFLTTLVDRIVPGYPGNEVNELTKRLGYEDKLLCATEPFYLWAIEAPKEVHECIPFREAGLNVLWVDDIYPYKTRKVRMLNGTHIATAPVGILYGIETVRECINHEVLGKYMNQVIHDEILPSIEKIEHKMLKDFADLIEDRFKNPYIEHKLITISLNCISKVKERTIPSIKGYIKAKGNLPEKLTFAMASIIAFYNGAEISKNKLLVRSKNVKYQIDDEKDILEFFREEWTFFNKGTNSVDELVKNVLQNTRLWDEDLTKIEGLCEGVSAHLKNIIELGIKEAIMKLEGMK